MLGQPFLDGLRLVEATAVADGPCYLLTIIPAPYCKKHGKRPDIVAFAGDVTAAAIGAIADMVIVLGRRTLLTSGF